MKKYAITAFALTFLVFRTYGGERECLNFIYCSDLHYGLEREFRGGEVSADSVSRAMIGTFRLLEDTPLPEDGGVAAGTVYGKPAFVICTGDIANRMEDGVQPASVSWSRFREDWSSYCIIGNQDSPAQDRVPLYLVPGNHDISNAIGYTGPLEPEKDAASAAGIWNHNMAETPCDTIPVGQFDYNVHKTHYSFIRDSVRFVFMGMWPDSSMRGWYEAETADSSGFPVLLFTHDPPEAEAKHFTNPSGKHDINDTDKFQNLLSDISSVRYPDMEPEGNWKTLENFIASRPEIRAWFHGDKNYNEFYIWKGVDDSISLPVFRVDSPMKGEYSSEDETLLSFIAVSVDPHGRRLTARECLWNAGSAPGITWGKTCTISL